MADGASTGVTNAGPNGHGHGGGSGGGGGGGGDGGDGGPKSTASPGANLQAAADAAFRTAKVQSLIKSRYLNKRPNVIGGGGRTFRTAVSTWLSPLSLWAATGEYR